MIRTSYAAVLLATGMFACVALRPVVAEDAPTTKPADKAETESPKKAARAPRVTGIWAKVEGLSDEQKSQIAAIHRKTLAEKRKLDEQEEADIKALLTDEQKKEVDTMREEASAKRKEAMASRKSTDEKPAEKAVEKAADEKPDDK